MTRWNTTNDEVEAVSPDITDEANALPARYFTDPAVHVMEKDKIFGEYWVYAGHANAIQEQGAYFTRTVGDRQVIVVRDAEGEVRAFFNVCAHRGSKMVEDTPMTDPGNMGRIRCPYHMWTYDLDGDLTSTPKSFEEAGLNPDLDDADVCGLDPEANGLREVETDRIGPLVFLNFAEDPMPLAEQAGTLKDELEALPLGEYEHAARYVSEVECNWKTFAGNYSECDHCHANHQDWISGVELNDSELEVNDYYWVLHYTHAEDVDDEMRIHDEHEATFYYFWPNFTVNMYGTADGYGTYIIDPIDEGRFQLVADYYFESAEMSEDEREFVQTSRQLQEEDFELVERQYEGLESGALAQAQLGPNEHTVHKLHRLAQEAYEA
ncbi:aromatic ring-hydroxylating oxygenase subunit alpha [Haloarcula pellucida]|uniref:Ring-hydroxylating oxygenase subunit alpha n=1 Tax=Haloarcula pellucida TaxID=1427151 RepID=A0A830GIG8_9EURY|nr:aromatic ring-hydroxylating dioxygenase subunit alpha [Halomicroarcula pellucida]MBX0348883.1 aromatic ring-hydroxylating dioxygenase subunit alpha [Halomicroarcula pellucida]GGN91385.1 ring-hydroxylating oxygenase subunit alpha [Halomicroarcula pellucida]